MITGITFIKRVARKDYWRGKFIITASYGSSKLVLSETLACMSNNTNTPRLSVFVIKKDTKEFFFFLRDEGGQLQGIDYRKS